MVCKLSAHVSGVCSRKVTLLYLAGKCYNEGQERLLGA